nr:MAG TPA: hypothetical protein [Caudoviricetes sp.]
MKIASSGSERKESTSLESEEYVYKRKGGYQRDHLR